MKKRNVTAFILALSLIFGIVVFSGCGSQETSSGGAKSEAAVSKMSPEVAKIYEAAKKEGSVIYWSPDDVEEVKEFEKDFNKIYPGIKVEHFQIQPPQALERIITEANANQTNLDVIHMYLTELPKLIDRGLITQYDWNKTFGVNKEIIKYNNHGINTYHLSFPIAYNTNLLKKDEVPKSWEELLEPKWKGKLLVEVRGNAFPILALSWGEDKTVNYLKKLLEQKPIIIKGGTPTVQAVANGDAPVAIGTYAYMVEKYKRQGAPIDWAKVGPIPLIVHTHAVMKKAPHPNAGLLFTAWMASKEGVETRERVQTAGRMIGENLSKIGKEMEANKIERIPEDENKMEILNRMKKKVADILSGLGKK